MTAPASAPATSRSSACAHLRRMLRGACDAPVDDGAQSSMLKLPDAELASALGMSHNASAAFRAATNMARFQPIQGDGACARACNITQ